jgi:hypothetical protein
MTQMLIKDDGTVKSRADGSGDALSPGPHRGDLRRLGIDSDVKAG